MSLAANHQTANPEPTASADLEPTIYLEPYTPEFYRVWNRYALSQPISPAELAALRRATGRNPDGTIRKSRYELAREARERTERRAAEREAMREADAECYRAERGDLDAAWLAGFDVGYTDGRFGRLYLSGPPSGLDEGQEHAWRSGYAAGAKANFRDRTSEINAACESA